MSEKNRPTPFAGAYVTVEFVIPSRSFGYARPTFKKILVEADTLAELDAKIARARQAALELGIGAHVNLVGPRYVWDPETSKYKAVDLTRALVEAVFVGFFRYLEDVTRG